MSEILLDDGPAVDTPAPLLNSLEHRVAERRRKLEAETTHKFDVPGYEGIFRVELQLVGGKRQHQVVKKHEVVRNEYQQTLRVAAELLLSATVAFYAVSGDDEDTLAEGCTWKRLAKAANAHLDDSVLEAPGGNRVALISLIGEDGVFNLAGQWRQWMNTRGAEVESALEDFS